MLTKAIKIKHLFLNKAQLQSHSHNENIFHTYLGTKVMFYIMSILLMHFYWLKSLKHDCLKFLEGKMIIPNFFKKKYPVAKTTTIFNLIPTSILVCPILPQYTLVVVVVIIIKRGGGRN